MLGWIYDATVCPDWEGNGEGIISIDTPGSVMVPEISVNTLVTGLDASSKKCPKEQLSGQFMEEDSRVLKLLNTLTISEINLTAEQLVELRSLVAEYSDIFALDMSESVLEITVRHQTLSYQN